jgi:hypothetical protein
LTLRILQLLMILSLGKNMGLEINNEDAELLEDHKNELSTSGAAAKDDCGGNVFR